MAWLGTKLIYNEKEYIGLFEFVEWETTLFSFCRCWENDVLKSVKK